MLQLSTCSNRSFSDESMEVGLLASAKTKVEFVFSAVDVWGTEFPRSMVQSLVISARV